jgi:Flp pilus assembly protein TadG
MSRRKKNSGGQAIVMVTLALFSMMGMMGLAVDLGWSYFSQKQAQAAADTAALAAAQEAVSRLGPSSDVSGFNCGSTGVGANKVECTETAGSTTLEYCGSSVASASNLNNGCLYAKRNGFQYDVTGSKQIVSMQSGDVTDVNAPGGVKRISYWVRVRTIQTVPQLFSFVAGHEKGTVAANATAAIAGSITPGSFYGMDRKGDCLTGPDAGHCGLDVITGHGKGGGSGGSQACAALSKIDLCAPAGIILASSCDGTTQSGVCDDGYAGVELGGGAAGSSLVIMGPSGAVNPPSKWTDLSGNPLSPTITTNASTFADPTSPNAQPPLVTPGSSIGTCAIPHQAGTNAVLTGTLGPYMYFSYHATSGGKPVPDGGQISITGTATFSQGSGSAGASAGCPAVSALVGGVTLNTVQTGGVANQTTADFPTYIFMGGLQNNGTMTLGPGQYVMAGTTSTTGYSFDNQGTVDGTSSAAQATGTMFIFTDAAYPNMNLASNTAATVNTTVLTAWQNLVGTATGVLPPLYQGSVNAFSGTSLEMYGLVNSTVSGSKLPAASNMDAYTGITWWQDRRNSNVGYDEASGSHDCTAAGVTCNGDTGDVISCAIGCTYGSASTPNVLATTNHVTANSVGVYGSNGNAKIALHGVWYQPRGAYLDIANGNVGVNCPNSGGQCPLQLVTGAVIMASGTSRVVLLGPDNPLITYKAVLIQ